MKLKNQMAIQIVKNEKLLCETCLISSPFSGTSSRPGESEAVYCNLDREPETKHKSQFCSKGLWLINGEVKDFGSGFQAIYNKNKATGEDKEITL
jgi:hypothetical protein